MGIVKWEGVYPAVTTKFDSKGNLDLKSFSHNIQIQHQSGVSGIIIGGTLGEASTLLEDEKQELVATALAITNGEIPIILNIAEGSTSTAIQCVTRAEKWGVDGLMVLPPMRYASDTMETQTYFAAIAASTSLPIMLYHNPVDYKVTISIETFSYLLKSYPNIQAVKESTRDVTQITRLKNAFGDRLKVLCGVDTLAMESILLGADGWVAGLVCAFPRETMSLYTMLLSQDLAKARLLYRWFMPLLELDIHPKLVQYIKLCESMTGLGTTYVRPPRLELAEPELTQIQNIIQNAINTNPLRHD